MRVPCIIMVEELLPKMRMRLAKELARDGRSQSEIATYLGVSQAMISRYLTADEMDVPDFVDEVVIDAVKVISAGGGETDLVEMLCTRCLSFRESGGMCSLHGLPECRICMNIASSKRIGERWVVLENLRMALDFLRFRFHPALVPEVRVNIAMALQGADSTFDVAAFPGRLTHLKGEMRALGPPEFGASRHLASVLLAAMGVCERWRAVIDIANNDTVRNALERTDLSWIESSDVDVLEGVSRCLGRKEVDCVLHHGEFGLEPCIYIFGTDAVDAARKVAVISYKLGEMKGITDLKDER